MYDTYCVIGYMHTCQRPIFSKFSLQNKMTCTKFCSTLLLTTLVIVLTLNTGNCAACVYYVKPSRSAVSCPSDPCHTLDNYFINSAVFSSNTIFCFLPGYHFLERTPNHWFTAIKHVSNVTFVGVNATGELFSEENLSPRSAIVCGGSVSANRGIAFINVSKLSIIALQIQSCGAIFPSSVLNKIYTSQIKSTHPIGKFKAALFMANVKSFITVNTVIVNNFGYGMFGINAVGSLTSVSFIRNNYYAYHYEPRCYCTRPSDLHCRGGNALFLFQDFASESQCPEGTNLLDIKNASFYYGVNLCNSGKFPSYIHSGGGFGVILSQACYRVAVTLDSVHAEGNSGVNGGNLYFFIAETVHNSSVRIQYTLGEK